MACYRPAGMSDEEDDEDFELSSDFDTNRNSYRNQFINNQTESEESLFYTALINSDIETMKTMLNNGFDVDQPLSGGWSPLMYACSFGLLPVVEFLLEAKANVHFDKDLFTPLMALCKSSSLKKDELIKCFIMLLTYGAKISATDKNACTPLIHACSSGNIELAKQLIHSDCDINIQDIEGWSALFHAVSEGREDMVQVLLEGKARVDLIDKRRRSAFDLALQKGFDNLGKLVCSNKEKRKLLEEEENMIIPNEIIVDPVEAILKQLPRNSAKSTSGFSSDVSKQLWSMRLGHLSKQLVFNDLGLNEFLLINNELLKELGVRFSVHRQRILHSIRKFHLHQWKKSSLGMKPRNIQMDVEDAVRLMCNITKHLHVLTATLNYVRIHQPVPIQPEVFIMCEKAIHQLNLISGELVEINLFAINLKHKEKIEPVELIKPRKSKHNYFLSIFTLTIIGFFIWARKCNTK